MENSQLIRQISIIIASIALKYHSAHKVRSWKVEKNVDGKLNAKIN